PPRTSSSSGTEPGSSWLLQAEPGNFPGKGRSNRQQAMSANPGRVLLAVSPQTRIRLQIILEGYDATWATTFSEVRAAAEREEFDLVVVGSHFEESSTFEIVRYLRARCPRLRIACVRGAPFPAALGRSTMKAFEAASEVLGAALVIDLFDYPVDE